MTDEIVSVERDRQGQRLDREGGGDSRGLEGGANRLGDPEVAKCAAGGFSLLLVVTALACDEGDWGCTVIGFDVVGLPSGPYVVVVIGCD